MASCLLVLAGKISGGCGNVKCSQRGTVVERPNVRLLAVSQHCVCFGAASVVELSNTMHAGYS